MKKQNVYYLFNLKSLMLLLVLLHHSVSAYTTGEDWIIIDSNRTDAFQPFMAIGAAFMMGLFFFISAYFVQASFQRYGFSAFIISKIKRLIIPTLLVVFTLLPLTYFAQTDSQSFYNYYKNYIYSGGLTFGHMWFVMQLFIYSLMFAIVHRLMPEYFLPRNDKPLTHSQVICYIVLLSVLTYPVALLAPINKWFGFHLVMPFRLPQYATLFALGIIAYQRDWLGRTSKQFGFRWLVVAVFAMAYKIIVLHFHIQQNLPINVIWISIQCVSLSLGLIILFREYCNVTNQFLRYLSVNSYAVYIVHVPVLIWLNRWLLNFKIGATQKALIVWMLTVLISYLLAGLLKKSTFTHLLRPILEKVSSFQNTGIAPQK